MQRCCRLRGLFLPAARQSDTVGPAVLYDTLLPALANRPTLAHASTPEGAAALRWREPHLSGDASHAQLALEAFEATLCAAGLRGRDGVLAPMGWATAAAPDVQA